MLHAEYEARGGGGDIPPSSAPFKINGAREGYSPVDILNT